ncbi:MAG TPA: RdgB/HAM1 family non-canonical purine NTP pyrophosphatase [Candidatus Acidoferrales bacterium]
MKLLIASSNSGKLREYKALAAGHDVKLALVPGFASLPAFDESAPTFAENAAGKALHYSRHAAGAVIAEDSGLVVPALDGAPGVQSARYAGPLATDTDRVKKLLGEMNDRTGEERRAYFVCALAMARRGRLLAVLSDRVEGTLLDAPRGDGGFGYDPIFFYAPLGKTFAELPREQKNLISHRGRAFLKLLRYLETGDIG